VNGGFLNNMQPSGERLITGSLGGGLHKTGPLATGPLAASNLNTGPLSMATAS
jgi:hypothetical protein